ncbi:MAG: NAD(P)/FAD-dependent oxidoreductase [Chitinophagaceae bacterium]|nr:NAD(P)/FAD-dependent oxidoreductase [Chitinophagaceae bacterium]
MTYDGIIIGAGHNSLVLQAYLCKAGLNILCIERSSSAGGGLTTVEDPANPGFFHNTHSFYHRALNKMPWYKDLELEKHGATYIEPEFNVALLLKNGESLDWWTNFDKTVESFERFSRKDAEKLKSWRERFLPIVEKILVPESQSPPVPPEKRQALLEKSREGRLLLEASALAPIEFVLKEFEHPTIQAGLLFFNGLREVDLRCKGFGHHIPALLASPGKAQMCKGGSVQLANALVSSVKKNGGEIKLRAVPRRIIIERGKATGVETVDGEIFHARHFVASGLNPQQTFLELTEEKYLPADLKEKARNFKYNIIAPLFGLNLNLSAPPQYTASEENPDLKKALMIIVGLEHYNQYPGIVTNHENGTIPPTVMWGTCPTIFDPTQAPEGKHTAFMWEKLPYHLHGDPRNWDKYKNDHGKKMLDVWSTYAPNLQHDVIDWFTRSPLDTERTFPNMKEGDLLVGAFTNGQIGYNRPFAGAGHYRGHVQNLYLCGSSCHPGGNITGLPGYNCAQVVYNDLHLDGTWMPVPAEIQLNKLC